MPAISHARSANRSHPTLLGAQRAPRAVLAAVVVLVSRGSPSAAQQLDSKFWEANGRVNAIAAAGGTVYIGGQFTYVKIGRASCRERVYVLV